MSNSNKGVASLTNKKEKGKNGRFNLIDLILVVLVLLVIAILFQVFSPFSLIKKLSSNQTREIQYTVEFSGVDAEFINRIKEEDLVINSVSKNNMGKVVTVSYYPYSEFHYVETENEGHGELLEHPNKSNLIVTISATANYVEGSGYSVNSTRIAVGEKLALRFPDYVAEGYCIYLETE